VLLRAGRVGGTHSSSPEDTKHHIGHSGICGFPPSTPSWLVEMRRTGLGPGRVQPGSGAGLYRPFRRRPHLDLEAAMARLALGESRHGSLRPRAGLYCKASEIGVWCASHSATASSITPCKSVPLASAASLKRAAVSRGIEKVMFVDVFSSLPWGFVRKCLKFRFLTLSSSLYY
jgi:hypothetical protein